MDKAQLWHGNISRWQRRQMGKIFHTETFEAKFLCRGDRQEQTGQFASPGSAATLSPASSTSHSFHFQKLHLLWNLPTVLQLRILVVWELGGLVHWTHAMYEPLLNSVSSFDAHVYHTLKQISQIYGVYDSSHFQLAILFPPCLTEWWWAGAAGDR